MTTALTIKDNLSSLLKSCASATPTISLDSTKDNLDINDQIKQQSGTRATQDIPTTVSNNGIKMLCISTESRMKLTSTNSIDIPSESKMKNHSNA